MIFIYHYSKYDVWHFICIITVYPTYYLHVHVYYIHPIQYIYNYEAIYLYFAENIILYI